MDGAIDQVSSLKGVTGCMVDAGSLPFRELFSCGLGIAVLNYLDNLGRLESQGDPGARETQEETRKVAQGWIQHSDLNASLDEAFLLWDAVCKGIVQYMSFKLIALTGLPRGGDGRQPGKRQGNMGPHKCVVVAKTVSFWGSCLHLSTRR